MTNITNCSLRQVPKWFDVVQEFGQLALGIMGLVLSGLGLMEVIAHF
jgi:hypothetical protein